MRRVIAIFLVVAFVATSGVLVSLAKAGVFSRSKDNEDTTTETASTEEQTNSTIEVETHNDGISKDDPLYNAKITLKVNVTDDDLKKFVVDYTKKFDDISMPSNNDKRTSAPAKVGWGEEGMKMYDAVGIHFSTVEKGKTKYSKKDIETMVDELRKAIRRNPVIGMMVLEGMQYMELTDGTIVAELNADWVKKALELYDKYGVGVWLTYHTKYWEIYGFELPHDGQSVEEWRAAHPDAPEVTEELMERVTVSDEKKEYQLFISEEDPNNYDKVSKYILMWLDRLTCEGVETYSTSTFWYLNSQMDANLVRAIRNTDKNRVESLPSLNFSARVKDDNGKIRQIFFGFNIYDMRLLIFERTATPTKTIQPSNPKPTGNTNPPAPTGNTNPPNPSGGTNPPNPSGGTNPPNPNPGDNPNPPGPNPPKPPTPVNPGKDDGDGSVHHGDADKGGSEGQGGTGAPTGDHSKDDMQDAHGGSDQNQGHSNPNTVTPDTPPASNTGHQDNAAGSGTNGQNAPADDHNSNTVENTNESQMNYGEDSGAKSNDDVNTSGSGAPAGTDNDMSNDMSDGAIAEPGT